MSNSHRPVIPEDDNPSLLQVLRRFVPMIILYSMRHLTVGTIVRQKLKNYQRMGKKWIVEDNLN